MCTKLYAHCAVKPVAIETLGRINDFACEFLSIMGHKTSLQSGNDREASFLFQWLFILIQQLNAILPHDSFVQEED